MNKGERLPDDQVRSIRKQRRRYQWSYREMSLLWNVSHMTIARIVRGETYKGVK